jgi:nucleoid-associated protein YgaU
MNKYQNQYTQGLPIIRKEPVFTRPIMPKERQIIPKINLFGKDKKSKVKDYTLWIAGAALVASAAILGLHMPKNITESVRAEVPSIEQQIPGQVDIFYDFQIPTRHSLEELKMGVIEERRISLEETVDREPTTAQRAQIPHIEPRIPEHGSMINDFEIYDRTQIEPIGKRPIPLEEAFNGTSIDTQRAQVPHVEPTFEMEKGIPYSFEIPTRPSAEAIKMDIIGKKPISQDHEIITHNYIVQRGDNLNKIAGIFLPEEDNNPDNRHRAALGIAAYNNLANPNLIFPGQELTINIGQISDYMNSDIQLPVQTAVSHAIVTETIQTPSITETTDEYLPEITRAEGPSAEILAIGHNEPLFDTIWNYGVIEPGTIPGVDVSIVTDTFGVPGIGEIVNEFYKNNASIEGTHYGTLEQSTTNPLTVPLSVRDEG